MKYIITNIVISNTKIAEDNLSINIDTTVTFNIDGGSKLPDSSTGFTINMLLDDSPRSSMVSELNEKCQVQFDAQFNS